MYIGDPIDCRVKKNEEQEGSKYNAMEQESIFGLKEHQGTENSLEHERQNTNK